MNIEDFLHHTPQLAPDVYVHPTATVIGNVVMGEQSSVWPRAVIRGDVNHIRIGARSNIQDGSILHVSHRSTRRPEGAPLIIGDDVSIGHGVILHGCTLHNACLIGMGALVMDHAILQPNVLLGAGSLVPEGQVLESGWLYLGRPAKRVRPLTPEELAYFTYLSQGYVELARQYVPANDKT